MIRVFQVKSESSEPDQIEKSLIQKLKIQPKDLLSWKIHRQSVDARRRKVLFSYVIDANVKHEKKYLKRKDVHPAPDETYRFAPAGEIPLQNRPVVVGFGPAGMFAALLLAQEGYKPVVIERGSKIDQRQKDVERFWNERILNPESNVQFGEGGAGAFSDGKLTTRSKDVLGRKVLEELVNMGAKEEILVEQHPHIGTDAFVHIIENCRKAIEKLGGTFYFDTKVDDIVTEGDHLSALKLNNGTILPCQACILACGHSAEDTIRTLHASGVEMENKPFAIGMRIEHEQSFINEAMLGETCHNPELIPARYQLTDKTSTGKGVYSFCMCPGGYVIPAASQPETVVVNGMSYASRGGSNANAALLVQVDESDYGSQLFDGLAYQQNIEQKAWQFSKDYRAPVQLAKDYLAGKVSDHFEQVEPTYQSQTVMADLNTLFPKPVNAAMHEALEQFEQKVPGFVSQGALLCAPETRSSSSIRILRSSQSRMSNITGLYPAGEGSGYAGGIMTSAIDGMRSAQALMNRYAPALSSLGQTGKSAE